MDATLTVAVLRCMAISAAVFVGGIESWKDALLERARALNVGPGAASSTDVGPLITPEARDRAANLIQSGVDQVPLQPKHNSFCAHPNGH